LARLSADGSIITSFARQAWDDEFGMCTDKFGVHWMVTMTTD
jgi:PhnB protein